MPPSARETIVKTILVVDDEKSVRDVLGRFLRTLDYRVEFAENGLDALEKTKVGRPHLIILDVSMLSVRY